MKKKYEVEIEEILQMVVEEEAESLEEALNNVQDKYDAQEYVLDYENIMDTEIRAFGKSKHLTAKKGYAFNINIGKAVLLEGDENFGIIKRLEENEDYHNYIVVSGLHYNNEKDRFDWNEGKHCKNILEAIEYYEKLKDHELENQLAKIKGDLPNYKKVELYDVFMNELFELNNYSEAVIKLHNMDLNNEEICLITSLDEEELNGILEDIEEEDEFDEI